MGRGSYLGGCTILRPTPKRKKRLRPPPASASSLAPEVAARRREQWLALLSAQLAEVRRRRAIQGRQAAERDTTRSAAPALEVMDRQIRHIETLMRSVKRSERAAADASHAGGSRTGPAAERLPRRRWSAG